MEGLEHSIHFTPGIGGKPYRPWFYGLCNGSEYSTGGGEKQGKYQKSTKSEKGLLVSCCRMAFYNVAAEEGTSRTYNDTGKHLVPE